MSQKNFQSYPKSENQRRIHQAVICDSALAGLSFILLTLAIYYDDKFIFELDSLHISLLFNHHSSFN